MFFFLQFSFHEHHLAQGVPHPAHRGGLELQIDVSDEAEGIGHLMVVPYGESADCYSIANCPQGKFSINLS